MSAPDFICEICGAKLEPDDGGWVCPVAEAGDLASFGHRAKEVMLNGSAEELAGLVREVVADSEVESGQVNKQ